MLTLAPLSRWLAPDIHRARITGRRSRRRRPLLVLTELEDRTAPAVFTVTSLADSGAGSLRTAIASANTTPGADTITFGVAGTINVASQLTLSDTTGGTTIDATTAPGYAGAPVVALQGPGGLHGLDVFSPNNTIQGLQIKSFTIGLYILGAPSGNFGGSGTAANTLVAGNYIGTDGTSAAGGLYGIVIDGSANNRIGVVNGAGAGNVVSGNANQGIRVIENGSTGNVVAGNFIGTNAAGDAAVPNTGDGVSLLAPNNTVGTDGNGVGDAAERNVISGNTGAGVFITGTGNVVAGNFIGTNAAGNATIGNATFNNVVTAGVFIGSGANRVGTNGDGVSDAEERNVISGNNFRGITVNGANSVIAGNFIGINAAGTAALGNLAGGILVGSGTGIRVGTDGNGTADAAERNVISGNGGNGIAINSASVSGTVIAGNYVGVNAAGTAAVPNTQSGVRVDLAQNTRIGTDGNGTADAAERNVISGNGGNGIEVLNVSTTVVAGNYIGTDVTGAVDLGNVQDGIQIGTGRVGTNADGVNDAAERNVISGNNGSGVLVFGTGAVIAGNVIGTTAAGTAALGNSGDGVLVLGGSNTTVGGTAGAAANVVAFNGGAGVFVLSGTGNAVRGNAIFSNAKLGIDLGTTGVTVNDAGDADTGANNLQNFPVLSSAASSGGTTTIAGSLSSQPNTTYAIDFFASAAADPSGFGEGQRYLGSASVTTNAGGNSSFTVTLAAAASNEFITATATDPSGNTSEFSGDSVKVPPPNQPPVATNDSYSTNEDNTLNVPAPGVLANDSDADGNPITAVLVSGPASGVLTLNANGLFTYTPATNFNGSDSFSYKANDGTADSNVATVTIIVNPVNDAPGFTKGADQTVAEDAGPQTISGWAANITAGPANESGQMLQFLVTVDNPVLFSALPAVTAGGTLTFTTATDANGSATVTVRLMDNGGTANGGQDTSAAQTFIITATAVNDAPVAAADSYNVNEDTTLSVAAPGVLANDSDVDADLLHAVLVSGSTHGTVGLNADGSFTYTPAANFNGTDGFTYKANDGTADSNVVTVTITVDPVNDAPVAVADSATTDEDTAVTISVRANDTDVEGDALTVAAVTQGGHGTATIDGGNTVTYTPAANYFGSDTFTYTISDGHGGTATATVTVMIGPVNDAPVAAADSATTNEDTEVAVNVLANDNDIDGDALAVTAVTQGTHGTVVINGDGTVTYTPAANFNGTDGFTYTVSDGNGGAATAAVTITVAPVNDAPTALADAYSTNEDAALTVAAPGVLANDSDGDGDALTAVLVSGPAHGTLTIGANGSFVYTPAANFNGADSFTYKASDGSAQSGTATVTITVAAVNDAPVAVGNMYTTTEGTVLTVAAPGVLQNDTDVDGDGLSAVLVTGPAHGTLILNANGSFTYTPAAGFSGTDGYTYRANDGTADSNVATVAITVNPAGAGASLIPDPCDPTKTALLVRGTAVDDTITITPAGGTGAITVKLNGASLGTFGPTGRIIVYGLEGDDDLQTAGAISPPVWLHGGGGDDRLKGGGGDDVLLGEDGDDMLVGGGGRDLLIGGEGADRIVGNADDDILVAGFTDHDANDQALCAIMDEWTSRRDFATRVQNLRGGPDEGADRANGNVFLNAGTVHDEGLQDVLTGSSGTDWFLFNEDGDGGLRDRVTDMSTFESMFDDDIDFIYVDPT